MNKFKFWNKLHFTELSYVWKINSISLELSEETSQFVYLRNVHLFIVLIDALLRAFDRKWLAWQYNSDSCDSKFRVLVLRISLLFTKSLWSKFSSDENPASTTKGLHYLKTFTSTIGRKKTNHASRESWDENVKVCVARVCL